MNNFRFLKASWNYGLRILKVTGIIWINSVFIGHSSFTCENVCIIIDPIIEKLKIYIRHSMLWEFKNNKTASETAKKISSVYAQRVVSDRQVRNWFFKFSF